MQIITSGLSCISVVFEFILDACVCEECASSFPLFRLVRRSGFGDSFGRVKDAAGGNIQEIIFPGGGLMCNHAVVCGGRMELKILLRD